MNPKVPRTALGLLGSLVLTLPVAAQPGQALVPAAPLLSLSSSPLLPSLFNPSPDPSPAASFSSSVAPAAIESDLPDSPGAILAPAAADAPSADASGGFPFLSNKPVPPTAKKSSRVIQVGQAAMPLTAGDKMVLSITRQLTLGAFASSLVASGYAHLVDSRPHYGTDKAGFGERLGAANLRSTVQSVLNFGVLSAALHDDPRYYVLGPSKPLKTRVIYAATRVLITRKDDGRPAANYPFLGAVVASAALTNAYYPERDRSFERSATGVLTTVALRAAVFELFELKQDIFARISKKH